jgi:hypothetical protein
MTAFPSSDELHARLKAAGWTARRCILVPTAMAARHNDPAHRRLGSHDRSRPRDRKAKDAR